MALLSSKTPGSIVKIKENGSFVNYIVLIHGYPVSNGTLIWRQSLTSVSKAVEKYTYDGSSADIYLTGAFYSSLDPYIQENIIPANIVYRDGYKGYRTINRTVFLLSKYETCGGQGAPKDGSQIPYLVESASRRATGTRYNLRSSSAWIDDDGGTAYSHLAIEANGNLSENGGGNTPMRPAFVLPQSIEVKSDGSIVGNEPPTTPSSLTFGTPYAGKSVSVTAGSSTDPDGDTITYVFERQIDSGSWTQVKASTARTITDTVPSSGTRVNYRVKARDSVGNESSYRIATAKNIIYNQPPPTPAFISYGTPSAAEALEITCAAVADPNGDQVTYVFERQVDSAGTQIAAVTSTSCTDTVPNSGTQVTYRVKARDPSNAESGYCTGETKIIEYPLTITEPGKPRYKYAISGDTMKVRWTPAAAPGGTQVTYTVEIRVDEETWSQSGQTTDNACTVAVPETTGTGSTIAVRVKASTADGSESEYVSGEPVEILWHKVVRRMPWALGTPFKARQFTLNPRGQFQTKLENALASATGDPEILPEPVFGDNSPAQIQAAVQAGTYKTLWNIGDEMVIPFADGNYVFRIADFDHDPITSSGDKAAITLEMKDLLPNPESWNGTASNAGGYPASALSERAEAELLPTLPEAWRQILVPVDKVFGTGGTENSLDTFSLRLFLPTEKEVFGTAAAGSADEGSQYPVHATAANRIKRLSNGSGAVSGWWTASAAVSSETAVCTVTGTGSAGISESNNPQGVGLMFCICHAPSDQ